MTLGEFKAFVHGMEWAMEDAEGSFAATIHDWQRMKEALAEVKDEPFKCGCTEMLEKWG